MQGGEAQVKTMCECLGKIETVGPVSVYLSLWWPSRSWSSCHHSQHPRSQVAQGRSGAPILTRASEACVSWCTPTHRYQHSLERNETLRTGSRGGKKEKKTDQRDEWLQWKSMAFPSDAKSGAGDVTQLVTCLSSLHETLGSCPS